MSSVQEIDLNFNCKNTQKNFVFESLNMLFLVKLLFASRLLTSKDLNHASGE